MIDQSIKVECQQAQPSANQQAVRKPMRKVIIYTSKESRISEFLEKYSADDVEVIVVFNNINQRLPNC